MCFFLSSAKKHINELNLLSHGLPFFVAASDEKTLKKHVKENMREALKEWNGYRLATSPQIVKS